MERRPDFVRIRAAFAASLHFRDLAAADLDALAGIAKLRKLRDGEVVSRVGTPSSAVWIVVSGSMRLSSTSPEGDEFVYALLGPGGFYGIGSLLGGMETTVNASSAGRSALAIIEGRAFTALLDDRTWLWRHMVKVLHRRLMLAMAALRDISVAPLPQRIARRLLGQAIGGGSDFGGGQTIELRLTQDDLARMLATSRSRVNVALKELERRGLVRLGYRAVRLIDLAGLRELCANEVIAF